MTSTLMSRIVVIIWKEQIQAFGDIPQEFVFVLNDASGAECIII